MSGTVSIAEKHGPGQTYGVKGRKMLTTLLVVCIVHSCGRAHGQGVGYYPGLRDALQQEDQQEGVESLEDQASLPLDRRVYRSSVPWFPGLSQVDYNEQRKIADLEKLAESLKDFSNLLRRQHVKEGKHKIPKPFSLENYPIPESHKAYKQYPSMLQPKFSGLNFRIPSQQMLDDVRPYPHDDDDFSFRDDGEIDLDREEDHTEHEVRSDDKKLVEESSGKGALEDIRVADDPTEFAYGPSDPRYYQSSSSVSERTNFPSKPHSTSEAIDVDAEDDREDETYQVQARNDDAPMSQQANINGFSSRDSGFMASTGLDTTGSGDVVIIPPHSQDMTGALAIAVVAGISAAATVGLIAFAIGFYNLQSKAKNASDVDYPAYGVTGPNKDVSPSGDRRLAQSAQMYHYQHQKQQIIAMEKAPPTDRHGSVSEVDSEEENEEGDYTVYECPGLAPTGEMEVKNPLFQDDPTPAQTPASKTDASQKK